MWSGWVDERERAIDVTEFRRLVHIGHGRAVLYLRDHDPEPYREALLDACLKLDVYDATFDGTFARYIADLITAFGDVAWFLERIASKLDGLEKSGNRWRALEILTALAVDGHRRAETIVRESLATATDLESFTAGSDALLEFDGLVGVVTIAQRIAELTPLDGEFDSIEPALMEAEERFGESVVDDALAEAAKSSVDVARFYAALRAVRDVRAAAGPRNPRPTPSLAALQDVVAGTASREFYSPTLWWRWGKNATDGEIRWVADQLTDASDMSPAQLRTLLSVFYQRIFPDDYHVLLRLAENHPGSVAVFALNALELVRHPDLRKLGRQWLDDAEPERRRRAIALLLANYATNDHEAILSHLRSEADEWVLHSYGITVREGLDEDSPASLMDALPILLERGPCALCREDVVEKLIEYSAFTAAMARECVWDANLDIRKLARDYLDSRA